MRKRFIIIPVVALATLGLNTNTVLANEKVSLINDKVYIEEGADIEVDWDALMKLSRNIAAKESDSTETDEVVADVVLVNAEAPVTVSDGAVQVTTESAVTSETINEYRTIEIPYGSKLTLEKLGLDTTSGRYEYTYKFYGTYKELKQFTETVVMKDTQTGVITNITITVNVTDTKKPTLKGVKSTIKIIGGKNVVNRIKKGVTAKDNVDGTITKRIKISGYKAKKYDKIQKVTFTVKDSSGNTTKKTVKLKIVNPVKKVKKTMYTKSAVNVRKTSSASGKKLGKLAYGTKVQVTGRDRNTGWYRIKYNGGTGWVSDSYLSKTKPTKKTSNNNNGSSNSGSSDCSGFCADNCDSACGDDINDCYDGW